MAVSRGMTNRAPYPSELKDRFIIRLPDGMRERIRIAADANNRSMNSEILATLEAAYPDPITDQEVFGLLRYILEAASPEELEARKVEVDAKLEAMGSRARIYENPAIPPGKVAIVKNPRPATKAPKP